METASELCPGPDGLKFGKVDDGAMVFSNPVAKIGKPAVEKKLAA